MPLHMTSEPLIQIDSMDKLGSLCDAEKWSLEHTVVAVARSDWYIISIHPIC